MCLFCLVLFLFCFVFCFCFVLFCVFFLYTWTNTNKSSSDQVTSFRLGSVEKIIYLKVIIPHVDNCWRKFETTWEWESLDCKPEKYHNLILFVWQRISLISYRVVSHQCNVQCYTNIDKSSYLDVVFMFVAVSCLIRGASSGWMILCLVLACWIVMVFNCCLLRDIWSTWYS